MSNTPLRPPGTKMLPHVAFIFSLFFIFVAELTSILNEEVSLRSTQCRRRHTWSRVLGTNPLFFVSSGRLRCRQTTAQSRFDCICASADRAYPGGTRRGDVSLAGTSPRGDRAPCRTLRRYAV